MFLFEISCKKLKKKIVTKKNVIFAIYYQDNSVFKC